MTHIKEADVKVIKKLLPELTDLVRQVFADYAYY